MVASARGRCALTTRPIIAAPQQDTAGQVDEAMRQAMVRRMAPRHGQPPKHCRVGTGIGQSHQDDTQQSHGSCQHPATISTRSTTLRPRINARGQEADGNDEVQCHLVAQLMQPRSRYCDNSTEWQQDCQYR
jgi:hypothetical protein